jgi:hypothetical protein
MAVVSSVPWFIAVVDVGVQQPAAGEQHVTAGEQQAVACWQLAAQAE